MYTVKLVSIKKTSFHPDHQHHALPGVPASFLGTVVGHVGAVIDLRVVPGLPTLAFPLSQQGHRSCGHILILTTEQTVHVTHQLLKFFTQGPRVIILATKHLKVNIQACSVIWYGQSLNKHLHLHHYKTSNFSLRTTKSSPMLVL